MVDAYHNGFFMACCVSYSDELKDTRKYNISYVNVEPNISIFIYQIVIY